MTKLEEARMRWGTARVEAERPADLACPCAGQGRCLICGSTGRIPAAFAFRLPARPGRRDGVRDVSQHRIERGSP